MMRTPASLVVLPLFLAACSSEAPATSTGGGSGPVDMPLAPPAIGMQLATTKLKVDAGAEQYSCWSFSVPSDADISLVDLENQIPTAGVHHWAVFTNTQPVKETGPWECSTMGATWGLVSGGGVGTPGFKFPDGTAMTLKAGTHIIFQLHLLNAAGSAIDVPPAYINLSGSKAKDLQAVGLLIAGSLDITVPAHGTDVNVSGGCPAPEAMAHIFSVFPHMHQLGKRITTTLQAGTTGPMTMLTDHAWDFRDQGVYPVTGSAAMGDQVNVTCHYDNPSDKDVHFGLSSKDEMCLNVLYYYPATKPSAYCGFGN